MLYEEFKSLIGAVLHQGLRGEALADALAMSVECGKIYESEDRLATDVYFSLLHYAAGEEEMPPAEREYFLDCLNGDREYNREDKLDLIRSWYDGYLFGGTEVYCPWALSWRPIELDQ